MTTNGSELLTLDEAASYLRVHRRTMGRLLRDGTVPGTKIGRQWRIRRTDLDALTTNPTRASRPHGAVHTAATTDAPEGTRPEDNAWTVRAMPLVSGSLASLIGAGLGLLT